MIKAMMTPGMPSFAAPPPMGNLPMPLEPDLPRRSSTSFHASGLRPIFTRQFPPTEIVAVVPRPEYVNQSVRCIECIPICESQSPATGRAKDALHLRIAVSSRVLEWSDAATVGQVHVRTCTGEQPHNLRVPLITLAKDDRFQ